MMELNDLPEALSTAVLQFCQENLRYEGSISVHGNVTVVANAHTAVSFFSKKLGGSTGRISEISFNFAFSEANSMN